VQTTRAAPAMRQAATPAAPPQGETLAAWQAQLLAHLALFKRFPPGAQERGEQGVVEMRVTLDHAGHVLSMALVGSSGYPDLDAEASAWIARAAPLPAFPAEITASQVNLVIPLRFTLQ
jgi:protein TonB